MLYWSEKYPYAGIDLKYADDKLSQGYEQTVSFFRHLVGDNNECRVITEKEFRFEIGWKLYVFDVRYQNKFSAPNFVKVTIRVAVEI